MLKFFFSLYCFNFLVAGKVPNFDSYVSDFYSSDAKVQREQIDRSMNSLRKKLIDSICLLNPSQKKFVKNFDRRVNTFFIDITQGIYCIDSSFGTGIEPSIEKTNIILRQIYLADLQFLENKILDRELIEAWLEDAGFLLKKDQKMDTKTIINDIKKQIAKIFNFDLKIKPQVSNHMFCITYRSGGESVCIRSEKMRSSFFKEWIYATDENLGLISNLEVTLNEEFAKACKALKKEPYQMSDLLQSHKSWLNYRNALVFIYNNCLNKDKTQFLLLRLICFNISRIYFYKKFTDFYTYKNSDKNKCILQKKIAPKNYFGVCAG